MKNFKMNLKNILNQMMKNYKIKYLILLSLLI